MRHLSIEKQCDIVHVYTYFLARISSPKTNKTPKLICVYDNWRSKVLSNIYRPLLQYVSYEYPLRITSIITARWLCCLDAWHFIGGGNIINFDPHHWQKIRLSIKSKRQWSVKFVSLLKVFLAYSWLLLCKKHSLRVRRYSNHLRKINTNGKQMRVYTMIVHEKALYKTRLSVILVLYRFSIRKLKLITSSNLAISVEKNTWSEIWFESIWASPT